MDQSKQENAEGVGAAVMPNKRIAGYHALCPRLDGTTLLVLAGFELKTDWLLKLTVSRLIKRRTMVMTGCVEDVRRSRNNYLLVVRWINTSPAAGFEERPPTPDPAGRSLGRTIFLMGPDKNGRMHSIPVKKIMS